MTAQIPEVLYLDGQRRSMLTCLPLPAGHPRLVVPPPPSDPRDMLRDLPTMCWRGYVGTWEIRDRRLYLSAVSGQCTLIEGDPLFADWVTETVRVADGEMVRYVHAGFGSEYERELFLTIKRGVVVKTRVVDHPRRP